MHNLCIIEADVLQFYRPVTASQSMNMYRKDMSSGMGLTGCYAYNDTLEGLYYGPGSVKTALPKLLDTLGTKRALVLTGRSLFHKTDIVMTVENILKEHDAYGATFYEIGQHSPIAQIKAGAERLKAAQADVIVTVGGGSPIDAAKAISHFLQQERGGPYVRQIAIPTTLSAAEYTFAAAYTDEEGNKVFSISPELAPAGIILDAQLTLDTPEKLWLSTGMRALDHAVESLYRPLVPPPIKHLCYAALADLYVYLPRSKADPQDVEARQKLQIASWMSLWPLKLETFTSFGLSHVLGHKLGATYSIPHGITSCLTLAPVVNLRAAVGSKDDKEWLANALFYLRKPSTGSLEGDIKLLAVEIQRLVDDLGLHSTLSQYNVPRGDIPKIAERAVGGQEDSMFTAVVVLLENIYA